MARANGDLTGMVTAWREIGRLLGYYPAHRTAVVVERPQRSLPNSLDSITDTQLIAIVDAAAPV